MSSRFYLPSTGVAAVSPAFWAGWEKTDEADRLRMVRTKISSAFATKTCSEALADPTDVLTRQYISDPIGVHDFTGCTWKAFIRCLEDDAKADFVLNIAIRVVSNDGNTIRFEISDAVGVTEFDNGDVPENRTANNTSSANSSQNGDRIVVEIGIYAPNGKTTLYTATMDFGDNSGTDLPENETETAQYCPWIEFSHDIPFWQTLSPVSIGSLESFGVPASLLNKIKTTDWKAPGTVTSENINGGVAWSNPDNAKVLDGAYASCGEGASSDWLRCVNFGFTTDDIPSGAVILGIEMEVRRRSSIITDDSFTYLRKSTGQVGDSKGDTTVHWSTSDEWAYYGHVLSEWNSGLTDSDIRDSGFGVDISAVILIGTAYIDRVRIRIIYSEEIKATEWKAPGTCANIARAGSVDNWSDPDNAKVWDRNFASLDFSGVTGYSDWLRCTNFGFAVGDLPAGALIEGFALESYRFTNIADKVKDSAIYLRKTAGQTGDNKAHSDYWESGRCKWRFYGQIEDDWNATLADTDIRDTDFGVDISILTEQALVNISKDRIQIRVFYTIPDGAQTLYPDGVVSLENFGTLKANFKTFPSAIGSLEAVGTPSVIQKIIIPDGIGSLEGFGDGRVNFRLFPAFVPSAEGFGTSKLNLRLLLSAIESEEAFGAHQLSLKLLMQAITSEEAFGNALLNLRLALSGIGSEEAFGEPVITLMLQYLYPDGIASLEAFGDAGLNMKLFPSSVASEEDFGVALLKLKLLVSSITSQEGFGEPKLTHLIDPSAIGSLEALGEPNIQHILALYPDGIESLETFGTTQLNLRLLLSAIESQEAFGNANVAITQTLITDAITSLEAFGEALVQHVLALYPDGIESLEGFGTIFVNLQQTVLPSGIVSVELVASPKLNFGIFPVGVESGEDFGNGQLNLGLLPLSVLSGEAFGIGRLNLGLTALGIITAEAFGMSKLNFRIFPSGISSAEAFGLLELGMVQTIIVSGIPSEEAFGFDSLIKIFAKVFKVMPRERIFEMLSRARIFKVGDRGRIKEVESRKRTFKVDPRRRTFPIDRR